MNLTQSAGVKVKLHVWYISPFILDVGADNLVYFNNLAFLYD